MTLEQLKRARKAVVDVAGTPVVLFWHNERVHALRNICIHKERELVKGVILNDRIVCPGHQWAFNLETGHELKMDRYQPTFDVQIIDGVVCVDPSGHNVEIATPAAAEPAMIEEGP
jgi:nitrite reductase (NADH) small subunit